MTGTLLDVTLVAVLLLAAAAATAVALTRDPTRQAIVLSGYGLLLAVLLVLLQAPDVAMAQLAVGTVLVPLLVVLAIAKTQSEQAKRKRDRSAAGGEDG